jgi:anti-anti-sigma factor
MVEQDSDFGFRRQLPKVTIRFEGDLDMSRIDELDRAVRPASMLASVELIADLTAVTFMDSSVIRWLLLTQEMLRCRHGRLRVIAARDGPLVRLVALTGSENQIQVNLLPAS